jgi:hypothetical protein
MTNLFHISFFVLTLSVLSIAEPKLTCTPQTLRGIPGEPLKVELTVETDRVQPIQLMVPPASNLALRTVEKIPIQRTSEGRYIQKRIVIWQGIEAGSTSLTNLAVQAGSETYNFPTLGITIDTVQPAKPPPAQESAE